MGNNGKKPVFVDVEEEYAREFKARCAMYGVSMASILRPAIDGFMKTHPNKEEKRRMID